MQQFMTIVWHEYLLFKRKFCSITIGSMVGPVLYLIAFGWGLGAGLEVDGMSYINYIIPGLIAMTSMTTSFSNIANNINISRTYDKTFEEFMVAPVNMFVFTIAKITAGALRGMYSALLILLLSLLFNTGLNISLYFVLMVILNCLVFSSLGFIAGVVIDSHADMGKFTNFIITPMSFLCGTFFPVERMPAGLKEFIGILPLTHTNLGLRISGEHFLDMLIHPGVLLLYFIVLLAIGMKVCTKAE